MLLELSDCTVECFLKGEPGSSHYRLLGVFKVPARYHAIALNGNFCHVISHVTYNVLIVRLHVLKKVLECFNTVNLVEHLWGSFDYLRVLI